MKIILLILAIFFCALSYSQENIIELPLTIKMGIGPFPSTLGGISPYSDDENNPWRTTYLKVTGIPANWINIKVGDIETNIFQTTYQNYLMGNLSNEFYESIQKSWNWKPDTMILSKKPIKCKIAFAYGKDQSGKTQMVVDTNNNFDFSDDEVFTPIEIDPSKNERIDNDSIFIRKAIVVSCEYLSNGKIVMGKVPLFVLHLHMNEQEQFLCSFPQYATAQIDGEEIAVCNGFSNLTYDIPEVVLVNDSIKNGKKAKPDDLISKNEYLKIKNKIYKFKSVDPNRNVLLMEKINVPLNQLYSAQVGFKAIPFEGLNFKSKSPLTLENYKGKYLLIDFWAVWCGPCIEGISRLKAMYDKLDKSKIEFLGVVGESPSETLENMIDKYSITWPQILSDETNGIIKKYEIRGYPTLILINPDGIIVAKNLRRKDLEDKINELMGK
jgi:Thiol-disulfide isomerase and thioredoxins